MVPEAYTDDTFFPNQQTVQQEEDIYHSFCHSDVKSVPIESNQLDIICNRPFFSTFFSRTLKEECHRNRGQQTFPIKGQIAEIFSLTSQLGSISTTQLCGGSAEAVTGNGYQWAQLCSNKTSFTK